MNAERGNPAWMKIEALRDVMRRGAPDELRRLIAVGVDLGYRDKSGYSAMIDAVHGGALERDATLLEFLRLLVEGGARLSDETIYAETATRVLSRLGRFEAVKYLLDVGADPKQTAWTPLIAAVATGTLADVRAEFESAPDSLETRDWWERTPWLIAILAGDIEKADFLRASGANVNARGRCGHPPLFYAINGRHPAMLKWLIDVVKIDLGQTDNFGTTPLIEAVESGNVACVELLVQAGVDVEVEYNGTPLGRATSREIVECLLAAGADPAELSNAGQRSLIGLPPAEHEIDFDFAANKSVVWGRVFGKANPERMQMPLWDRMVRSGACAYAVRKPLQELGVQIEQPAWCAQRYGQSLTRLPDGRIVQIAGEHEDSYDPDFCIYNDVIVHRPDGRFEIYGYPEAIFPPTDFQTATLIGDVIYLIGSLGYQGQRLAGQTPVYVLDTRTWRIDALPTTGDGPGWISRHRADLLDQDFIRITRGKVITAKDYVDNTAAFLFDVKNSRWMRESRV